MIMKLLEKTITHPPPPSERKMMMMMMMMIFTDCHITQANNILIQAYLIISRDRPFES